MNFIDTLEKYKWDTVKAEIFSKTVADVELALQHPKRDLEDFKALISPAAKPYLEEMAVLSNKLTQKRFGKTMQLYIPLYLSNICENHCVYCGFNCKNKIKRTVLNDSEIMQEVEVLKSYGYQHILLVTGESPKRVGVDYLQHVIELIRPHFSLISIEVQPLDQNEYEQLAKFGLNTIYVYQETYNRENYGKYHLSGKKSNFMYRLDTPDRLGNSEVHRIGLGCLLGLEDWRTDSFFTALHLKYLEKTYWKTKYSISFPRLRPHEGDGFQPLNSMNDSELVQLICAYRILDEEVELSMSVRESPVFRDNIIKLGVTSISAGSKTDPGGYATNIDALEQFEVHDDRTPQEIQAMIKSQGYEPVWKDWDSYMQQTII